LSESEKYVIWKDTTTWKMYFFRIATSELIDISELINIDSNKTEKISKTYQKVQIEKWFNNDSIVIIYDGYDLWRMQLDEPDRNPQCITSGYGRSNKIVFRLVDAYKGLKTGRSEAYLLIAGWDEVNKKNGFYLMKDDKFNFKDKDLKSYLYYIPDLLVNGPPPPIKADNAYQFIVQRQSSSESPNLYSTTDFIQYSPVSYIYPEQRYKWMTSELLQWQISDAKKGAGILYKPLNFDSHTLYPIIFNYYEVRSDELNLYLFPELSNGTLNIPWYLSRGYLVFVPDIVTETGGVGASIMNTIITGTDFIQKTCPFVDTSRMGLQGHSFGGYITNYIVGHTNRFRAAQSSAGISDGLSYYGSIGFGGQSISGMYEHGIMKHAVPPWENFSNYISNSPISSVHKIHTPMLIMHNNGDGVVPFAQSLELFCSLRRMRKPVWMLQYDNEGHIIFGDKLDFTMRQQQFFDHYLKGNAAPFWMTKGVSLVLKGIDSGLYLDSLQERP
jgi:dienelactone hydrolase